MPPAADTPPTNPSTAASVPGASPESDVPSCVFLTERPACVPHRPVRLMNVAREHASQLRKRFRQGRVASFPSRTMTVNRTTASRARRRRAKVGLGVGLGITLFAAGRRGAGRHAGAGHGGGRQRDAADDHGERRARQCAARTQRIGRADDTPLRDTPASVSVVTRAQLDDQQAKRLSDVVRNDASVVNDYAPVGYFEGFAIRGFPVDLASAIRIDEPRCPASRTCRSRTRSASRS